MAWITDEQQLSRLYGRPSEPSIVKVAKELTPVYADLLAAPPFVILATAGETALDCSPRGDRGAVVRVADPKTLLLPDRRGNNRIDSLRNILRDPRVGMLFLIPGSGTTLRINGTARISVDPELLQSFAADGHLPRSVIVIRIETVFFQCARCIVRSGIWDPATHVAPQDIPSAGRILEDMSSDSINGPANDAEWPERARKSLW